MGLRALTMHLKIKNKTKQNRISWDADHQYPLRTLNQRNCWRLLRLWRRKDASVLHQWDSKDPVGSVRKTKTPWSCHSLLLAATSEKSSHSPPWLCWLQKKHSSHQIWGFSEPFLQFQLFQYFSTSCLRGEDHIQHNDSCGLQPTHSSCGPEKAMCFLHWQQLVSTTDALVTNPSTEAQSEQDRNCNCRGLSAWIWEFLCIFEQVQSILLQGSRNTVLAFPYEHHPAQHTPPKRKECLRKSRTKDGERIKMIFTAVCFCAKRSKHLVQHSSIWHHGCTQPEKTAPLLTLYFDSACSQKDLLAISVFPGDSKQWGNSNAWKHTQELTISWSRDWLQNWRLGLAKPHQSDFVFAKPNPTPEMVLESASIFLKPPKSWGYSKVSLSPICNLNLFSGTCFLQIALIRQQRVRRQGCLQAFQCSPALDVPQILQE